MSKGFRNRKVAGLTVVRTSEDYLRTPSLAEVTEQRKQSAHHRAFTLATSRPAGRTDAQHWAACLWACAHAAEAEREESA